MDSPERQDKIYNLINLEEISGGSDDFIRQMIALFIDQAERTVTEMEKAVHNNDIKEIKNLAHQLKPSADNIRVGELSKEIRIVEELAENQPGSPELANHISLSMGILREVVSQLKRDYP